MFIKNNIATEILIININICNTGLNINSQSKN